MEAHPHANIFPMMPDKELQELAVDIKNHGQREPIIQDGQGRIIDGRNRLKACEIAGVSPRFETFDGDDAEVMAYIVSTNIMRRHLTVAQRAELAASIATGTHGGARHPEQAANLPLETSKPTTQKEAAKLCGVSERSVRKAARVKMHGSRKVQEALKQGKKSLHAAERVTDHKRDRSTGRESIVLDCGDRRVPDNLRSAHEGTAHIDNLVGLLGKLRSGLHYLSGEPGCEFLESSIAVWIDRLNELTDGLKGGRYFSECPRCRGRGADCDLCEGHLYIPYARRDLLTNDEQLYLSALKANA